jgi:hypothetical protein
MPRIDLNGVVWLQNDPEQTSVNLLEKHAFLLISCASGFAESALKDMMA